MIEEIRQYIKENYQAEPEIVQVDLETQEIRQWYIPLSRKKELRLDANLKENGYELKEGKDIVRYDNDGNKLNVYKYENINSDMFNFKISRFGQEKDSEIYRVRDEQYFLDNIDDNRVKQIKDKYEYPIIFIAYKNKPSVYLYIRRSNE